MYSAGKEKKYMYITYSRKNKRQIFYFTEKQHEKDRTARNLAAFRGGKFLDVSPRKRSMYLEYEAQRSGKIKLTLFLRDKLSRLSKRGSTFSADRGEK